jgi:hypothetical protein
MLPKSDNIIDSIRATNKSFEVFRDWWSDFDIVICEDRLLSGIVWELANV